MFVISHGYDANAFATLQRGQQRRSRVNESVCMNTADTISRPNQSIETHGLAGCDAVALVSHDPLSKQSSVLLAHFPEAVANPDHNTGDALSPSYTRALHFHLNQIPVAKSPTAHHVIVTATEGSSAPSYLTQPIHEALAPNTSIRQHHIHYSDADRDRQIIFRISPDAQSVDYAAFRREFGTISDSSGASSSP